MKIEKNRFVPIWLYAFVAIFLLSSFLFVYMLRQEEGLVSHWNAELVGGDERYQTGQAYDMHLILEDEQGLPIDGADVMMTLERPVTIHNMKKVMHHVEGGLYETEAIFSLPGTWIVMIEANHKGEHYLNQFLIEIEGPIIAPESRDPDDAFQLGEHIPALVQQEIDQMMIKVFEN